jgi:hypothetical protein
MALCLFMIPPLGGFWADRLMADPSPRTLRLTYGVMAQPSLGARYRVFPQWEHLRDGGDDRRRWPFFPGIDAAEHFFGSWVHQVASVVKSCMDVLMEPLRLLSHERFYRGIVHSQQVFVGGASPRLRLPGESALSERPRGVGFKARGAVRGRRQARCFSRSSCPSGA